MVYVSIDEIGLEKYSLFIDMSVFGAYPEDSKEVMKILTQVFTKLVSIKQRNTEENPIISDLEYYFGMLAREKIYIASIPENTYVLRNFPSQDQAVEYAKKQRDRVVDIFVDVGSPLKHIYTVSKDYATYNGDKVRAYRIIGRGYLSCEEINIHVDFLGEIPYFSLGKPRWVEVVEKIKKLMRDSEIHIGLYPDMDKKKRMLLKSFLNKATEGDGHG